MTNKLNILAGCLFEAIDDVNLSNVIVLLEKHGASPNTIIPRLNIAPIHYAVGFDNLEFAEKVTAIFLKKKADPNLYSESDRLTPLHIACIWGRPRIVQLLLEYGADLNLQCNENQTPIEHAIQENHYEVIEIVKKFVFEQKMEKKKKELIMKSKNLETPEAKKSQTSRNAEESFSTPIKNNHLKNALQSLEEKQFTPNRINYNFDVTSPYYVNITHRRHKSSRENSQSTDFNDAEGDEGKKCNKQNLFDLTEDNLKQFSKQMSKVVVIDRLAIHKRRSYIKDWREKIKQIRKTDLKLDVSYINYLNSCNNVTLMDLTHKKEDSDEEESKSGESFITAKSDLLRYENAIRIQPEAPKYVEQVEEAYIHSDNESGVIFYEKKIISKSRLDLRAIEETDHDELKSQTSASTLVTLPPLDYDTDALRKELKHLTGRVPGPIGKNTKKLYLKQLVKLKKKPLISQEDKVQRAYSMELQRTTGNYSILEQNISDYLKLEAQMVLHFLERAHIKWREGNLKTSFIYLLIDPRISENLPIQHKHMSKSEVWNRFLSSIFYVGKGKRSRPYSHLYDAIKLFSMENTQVAERLENRKNQIIEKRVIYSNVANKIEVLDGRRIAKATCNINRFQDSKKLNVIVDIWKAQMGVVCLHVFNNIMPCEAYTREAAILEAIGIDNLTNLKRGEYYGLAKNFLIRQKRQMGIALLHRALGVYLNEGESQLLPFDLI